MLLRVCSLPPQTEKRCRGPRVLHGTSTKENTCLTLRYTPFASRLPAGPGWELSAIESGDAFMRLLKKAFLRSAYNADYRDADIVSRFDIIAVTKPLDEVEKPLNAVRWLSRRLADNGTLFLWQPALRMGTGLSLHGLPIRIANLTALCKTAGLSVDTITTEGEVVCLCARNTPQR